MIIQPWDIFYLVIDYGTEDVDPEDVIYPTDIFGLENVGRGMSVKAQGHEKHYIATTLDEAISVAVSLYPDLDWDRVDLDALR